VSSASDFPPNDVIIHWGDGSTSQGTVQLNSSDATSTTWDIFGSNTYVDAGLFTVTVHVMDVGGSTVTTGVTAGPVTVNVADGILTDATAANTINGVEGISTGSQLVATFTDTNPNATAADFTAGGGSTVIHWGDTTTSLATSAQVQLVSSLGGVSTWNVFASHIYHESGTFNVSVVVTDDDGNTVTTGQAPANTVTFTVTDAALTDTTSATGPYIYTTTEGHLINATPVVVATFTDANPFSPTDPIPDYPSANVVIDWGDGGPTSLGMAVYTGVTDASGSHWAVLGNHTYGEPTGSPYSVTVHVTDVDTSAIITSGTTVFVNDEMLTDITPVPPGQAEYDPVEGNSTGNQIVATFTDGNPNAPITDFQATPPSINWGDFTAPTAGTVVLVSRTSSVSTWNVIGSHTYAELGVFNISVTITDVDGSTVTTPSAPGMQVQEDVQDAQLVDATPPQIQSAVEGISTGQVVVATFNDFNPSAPPSDFTPPNGSVMIDWGDATPFTPGTLQFVSAGPTFSTWSVSGSHTYMEAGPFNVQVHVTDVDGNTLVTGGSGHTVTFTVVDAPLTDITVGTTNQVCASTALTNVTVATFSDANPFATNADFPSDAAHLAINWGDGTFLDTTTGFVTQIGSSLTDSTFIVQGSHMYAHAGVFNVSVFIMDEDGAVLNTPASGFNVVTFNVGPNNLKFTAVPSPVVSGHKFTVVVTGFDDPGDTQVSTGYFGPISLSIAPGTGPVGGHLGGITTVNAIAGVATFTNLTLDRASSTQYFLRATSSCGDFVDSPTGIEVTASAIIVSSSAIPSPNIYFPVTFTAIDVTGHVATNYTGPVIMTITQTPLYGRLSVLGGFQLVAIGHSLGSYPFSMGVLTSFLKSNKPGTFTVKWVAAGGFSGSFSWSFGRRLSFISNRIVTM
jgi:hypothetical protein